MSRYQDRGGGDHSGGYRHPLRVPDRYVARGRDVGNRDYGRDRDVGRPFQREMMNPYQRSRGGRGYEEPIYQHPPIGNYPPQTTTAYFNECVRPPGLIKKYPNYEPFHPPPSENFQYPEFMRPPTVKHKQRQSSRSRSRSCSRSRSRSRSRPRSRSRSRDRERHHYQRDREYHIRSYSPRRRRKSRSPGERRSRSRDDSHHRTRSSRSRSKSRETSVSHSDGGRSDHKIEPSTLKYWEQAENNGDDSEVDLEIDLHPLAYHVHSRKRLLTEAVRSLKGKRLKAMIPPLIKDMSIERLEGECLKILEDIDSETILNILEGKMGASLENSDNKETPVESASVASKEVVKKHKKKKATEATNKTKKIKKSEEQKAKERKKKLAEAQKSKKKKKKAKAKKEKRKTSEQQSSAAPTKSLMELLELEYRAKAIKALLRTQGVTGLDIDLAVGNDVSEVVNDLKVNGLTRAGHQPALGIQNTTTVPVASCPALVSVKPKRSSPTKALVLRKKKKMAENLETSLPPEVISSNQLGRAPSTDTISGTSCISSSEENDVQVKHGNLLSQVDEALNSEVSISDSNLSPSNNNANSFVLESCATAAKVNQLDGNQLRLKLLQKYKIRAKRVQKAKKKETVMPPVVKEHDDVLDLHADDKLIYEGDEDDEGDEEKVESEQEHVTTDNDGEKSELEHEEEKDLMSDQEEQDPEKERDSEQETLEASRQIESSQNNSVASPEEESAPEFGDNQSSTDRSPSVQDFEEGDDDVEVLVHGPTDVTADHNNIQEDQTTGISTKEVDNLEGEVPLHVTFVVEGLSEAEEGEVISAESDMGEKSVCEYSEDSNLLEAASSSPRRRLSKRSERFTSKSKSKKSRSPTKTKSLSSSPSKSRRQNQRDAIESRAKSTSPLPSPSPKQKSDRSSPVQFITNFDASPKSLDDSDQDSENNSTPVARSIIRPKPGPMKINMPTSLPVMHGCPTQDEVSNLSSNSKLSNISDDDTIGADVENVEGSDDASENEEDEKTLGKSGKESVAGEVGSNSEVSIKGKENDDGDEDDPQPITWYERWFQSKSMQKMVKTNNIQKKLKKKLKKTPHKAKSPPPPPDLSKDAGQPIIGSIEEYEQLFGKRKPASSQLDQSVQSLTEPQQKPEEDPEEQDDEDDDVLWGDIIGDDDAG